MSAAQTIYCRITKFVIGLTLLSISLPARAGTISFEGLPDSTILTNQYLGLTFTNAIVLSTGIGVNEFEFPPHSGTNVASDNNGPLSIIFSGPVSSFSGYFTYAAPLTLAAFNAANTQVASASSLFSANYVSSGNPPNELLQVSFAPGISRVTITGDPAGGSFVMDDITYTSASPATPEPGTLVFLTVGLGIIGLRHFKVLRP